MEDNKRYEITMALSDKINIYLGDETYNKLIDDCKSFEIFRDNGNKLNINKFYNLLINNFLKDYLTSIDRLADNIFSQLQPIIAEKDDHKFRKASKRIAYNNSVKPIINKEKNNKTLSIIINKDSIPTIAAAIAKSLDDVELSVFFRGMILSYLSLPTYKREQIIFAKRYKTVLEAIKKKESIDYVTPKTKEIHTYYPAYVETSEHELFNYVIGEHVGKNHHTNSIRLARMENVYLSNKHSEFAPVFHEHYLRMKKHGVQFRIDKDEFHTILLTKEGYESFQSNYLERPIPFEEKPKPDQDGNFTLTFNCSEFQFNKYFEPFKDKIIKKK